MATEDSALLALWEEWKVALYESLEATSEDASKAAHARSVEIEKRICETPAEGLHCIAVQLALWHFNSEPDEFDYAEMRPLLLLTKPLSASQVGIVWQRQTLSSSDQTTQSYNDES